MSSNPVYTTGTYAPQAGEIAHNGTRGKILDDTADVWWHETWTLGGALLGVAWNIDSRSLLAAGSTLDGANWAHQCDSWGGSGSKEAWQSTKRDWMGQDCQGERIVSWL